MGRGIKQRVLEKHSYSESKPVRPGNSLQVKRERERERLGTRESGNKKKQNQRNILNFQFHVKPLTFNKKYPFVI